MARFNKILVANRGEIAVRVLRTAKAQGYRTVAVYSEADRNALHVACADEAVCIGPAPVGASYMNVAALIGAAKASGADAVHPGYGFLSENAAFAGACAEAGITFIGPPQEAIDLMGNKRAAKIAMLEAGVPCVPGYEGDAQDDETLIREIGHIGFPVMIKAAAGGGGRGMRLVDAESDLKAELRSARSEARHGFGSDELILEKAIIRPRHVEIQVFGDTHGNVIHLGERDCSVQRRHQKVIEEAPSPAVDEDLRARMGEAAVQAAKSCQYVGAGTVEFLLDPDGNFYFLEMNTRLQVEHPVTELVTGLDLVAWQIRVAQGEPLPMTQADLQMNGHAMEIRLYAEDPGKDFMPQTGKVIDWQPAAGEGVRVDGGIQPGQDVTPFYDPILCKIICWGQDRDEARLRLIRALETSLALGVTTNQRFLRELLSHEAFAAGEATTAFIETEFGESDTLQPFAPAPLDFALAGLLMAWQAAGGNLAPTGLRPPVPHTLHLGHDGQQQAVRIGMDRDLPDRWKATVGDTELVFDLNEVEAGRVDFTCDGVNRQRRFAFEGGLLHFETANGSAAFSNHTWDAPGTTDAAGNGVITAPMDGAIVAVDVEAGATVEDGQTLVVLEAMKMEHTLTADVSGTVTEVRAKVGDQVKGRQVLVSIEPAA